MTEPPYGDQPPPYGTPEETTPYQQQAPYPQQELLPQQVQPGRSRLPFILLAVTLVVAVVAALVVWRLAHDDGEDTRAAYCEQLRTLTSADGLSGLANGIGEGGIVVPKAVTNLVELAPQSVRGEWDDLLDLVRTATGESPDVAQVARAFTDLQTIVADANSSCGMDLQFPG